MRLIIVVIALVASEIAYAAPVPRPRPLDAPARVSANRGVAASVAQTQIAIPVPRARPAKVGAEISPSNETKHAEAAPQRVASAVPMPYQRPSIAGVRTEGVSIVPKTIPIAPVKQPEVKQPEAKQSEPKQIDPPAVAKVAPSPVEVPVAVAPVVMAPVVVTPVIVAKPEVVKLPEVKSPETPPVEAKPVEAKPDEAKSSDTQSAEAEPIEAQSPEEKAAEALAIEAESGAHAGAPVREPRTGFAGKTLRAVKQFLVPHKAETPAANADTQEAQQSEPVAPSEPTMVASTVEPPAAPVVIAAAPDTSAPMPGTRPEMRPFTLPPDAAVNPLKSNGPANEAAKPPETTTEEQPVQVAQLSAVATAIAQAMKKIPAPRKRPMSAWPRPDDLVMRDVTAPTPEAECDAAMNSGILVAQRLQRLGHRGSCMVPYALRLDAIMVGRKRVDLVPPAQLRCGFALAIANWVRVEADPAADALGSQLVGIRQLDSYNCRTMSSTKRLMSEHSQGNALDVAEFIFANHHHAHLTNPATQKAMRFRLRSTACKRFKTVLGPGVPQHHDHIHLDLRKHFGPGGICHWNVL